MAALTGPRDLLPKGERVWEMVLTYDFELEDDAKVRPRPSLPEENESFETWESMLWQLYDSGKRIVGNGPRGSDADNLSLEKGKYTLRFHVRSSDEARLRKLKRMPVWIDRTLDKPLKLAVLDDPDGAVGGGHAFKDTTLQAGDMAAMWIPAPAAKDIPKGAKPGDLLVGTLRLGEEGDDLNPAGDRPDGWPLTIRLASEHVDEDKEKDEGPAAAKKKTPPSWTTSSSTSRSISSRSSGRTVATTTSKRSRRASRRRTRTRCRCSWSRCATSRGGRTRARRRS